MTEISIKIFQRSALQWGICTPSFCKFPTVRVGQRVRKSVSRLRATTKWARLGIESFTCQRTSTTRVYNGADRRQKLRGSWTAAVEQSAGRTMRAQRKL